MRHEFRLPAIDEQHLNGRGLPWEAIVDGKQRFVLVHDWPLPDGYNHLVATAALLIPTAYPEAALDMIYFRLSRSWMKLPSRDCQLSSFIATQPGLQVSQRPMKFPTAVCFPRHRFGPTRNCRTPASLYLQMVR